MQITKPARHPTRSANLMKEYEISTTKLTAEQVESLLRHCIRVPELLELAIDKIDLNTFSGHEAAYKILWAAVRNLVAQYGANISKSPTFGEMIRTEINAYLRVPGNEGVAEEMDSVLGNEDREAGDDDPRPALLDTAFGTPAESFSLEFGRDLLKRFLRERNFYEFLAIEMSRRVSQEFLPGDVTSFMEMLQAKALQIENVDSKACNTFSEDFPAYLEYLKQFKGKDVIGIKTGIDGFDRSTLGLRGFTVIGARPNVGKTAFAMSLVLNALKQPENQDVGVLFISLDMAKFELYARMDAHLSGTEYRHVITGFPKKEFANLQAARNKQRESRKTIRQSLGRRIKVMETADLRQPVSSQSLSALILDAKSSLRANRIITVIDYLQLLDVPETVEKLGDLVADKYRVKLLADTMKATSSKSSPKGEPIVAIAEARKPASSKEKWGSGLAELMGSARLAYAADAVLSIRDMDIPEAKQAYGWGEPLEVSDDEAKRRIEEMQRRGVVPQLVRLEKGRDGMTRGEWGHEFNFRTLTFTELPLVPMPTRRDNEPDSMEVTPRRRSRGRPRTAK